MSVPFVYVNDTINLILSGNAIQISSEHPSYGLIKKKLATASEKELMELIDVHKAVETFVNVNGKGRATVNNGDVYFDGKPVHTTLAKRIRDFIKEGLPFAHLLKFMENIAENPSYQSQQELFDFLEHRSLPITEDGCFLAYKAVRSDWMDKYSGTISNRIGNIVREKRSNVDDNRDKGCSKGLHCGALDYVYQYGSSGDRLIIVKVHPKNVVSVPKDCSYQKLRCCEYEVVREFEGELMKPLYTSNAKSVDMISDSKMDWSFCDKYVDAYDEGYYAYEQGKNPCDNPYKEGTDNYLDWEDGWYEAEDNEYDSYDDDDDDDDDCYSADDVIVTSNNTYGVKPDGSAYYNKRDKNGRFC